MTERPLRPSRAALAVALATGVLFACTTDTLIGPKDVALLVIEPDSVVMPVGDTVLLEGVATDSRGLKYIGAKIAWSSSNPSVATITTDGHLISVAVGTATVTAEAAGKSASAQVTVTPPAVIATSADSLVFAAVARGPLPAAQQIVVTNGSPGVLTNLAAGPPAYVGPDTGWLSLTSTSTTAPDSITFAVSVDTFPVGTYTATVPITAAKAANSPKSITVTLTLSAGPPATLTKTVGDTQTAVVKTAVATAPAVAVHDAYGNGVPGVSVTFSTTAGNGSLTGAAATTNAAGVATLGAWTLDTIAKADTLTVTAAALPAVTFTATATAAPASQMLKTAGDGQTAAVGTLLPTAPQVTVRDRFGNPVAGVTVTFAASAPSGSVTGATPVTNTQGVAAAGSWTLGTIARTDTVTATAAGVASPAIFTATATAGAAATLAKSAGGTTGTVNTVVAPAPAVLVTDQFGNAVAGVGVTFAATAANGTVTGGATTTNASGVATVGSFKLATLARTDTLTATSGSLAGSPVRFLVVASPDVPATATKDTGDAQTATAGSTLPIAPAVLVKDQFGNPVAGTTVTFAVASGGGLVTGATPTTNGSGIATVGGWQLGNAAGSNSLTATVGALPVLTFTATGTAGSASTLVLAGAASHSDTIGATLALDSVKVTDALNNPVAGTTVNWVAGGGGTITASSVTNAAGVATASRTLGTLAGPATDTAKVTGLTGSPVLFTTITTAGQASTLLKGAGDAQTDTVGATLAVAYTDSVKDRGGNPVAGVTVTWGVTGGGSITPSSSTGANGVATATRVLGTTAGTQGATGSVTGLAGSPTSFTATATHGAAKVLAIVAGTNNQSATFSTAVSPPPAAKVTDQFGNAVPGVTVTFALGAGGALNGSITGATPASDAGGVATLGSWTLGPGAPRQDTVVATAPGLTGSPLTFVDFANAGTATTLALAGGNGQSDTVRATLPRLDSVLVTDAGANPVQGVAVTWAATKGGGSITPSSNTDANGIAVATWTLGDTAGTQNATATVGGLAGSPVTFSATAGHGNAKIIALQGGDAQSATVNTAVATPPSVLVTDAYGNPVSGTTVTFAVTLGGGSLTGTNPASTSASGLASIGWTLGTTAGTNNLTATAAGLTGSPVTFTATGTAGAPTQMTVNGGNNQTAQIGTQLPTAPAVLVEDAFNNPVGGVTVNFVPGAGNNGSLAAPTSPVTSLSGIATAGPWTTGSLVKTDTLTASAAGLPTVTFVATVTAGAPAAMAISGGDAQTDTIGATLSALKVLVTDGGGNPVPGVTVNWLVTAGSATRSPASSLTDANGLAADTITLGTTTGAVTVQATTGAVTPADFSETVTAGNPVTIAQNGGDLQTATVNTAVATAPSVKVTDRAGNGVPGVGVTYSVPVNHGSVTGGSATTLATGVAAVGGWVLDSVAGANTLTATASVGVAGNPVTFSATGTAGAVSTSKSTLSAGTASITACASACAAGTTASTVTVTEVDQFGNPVSGSAVTFGSTGTANTFTPASGSTDGSGQLTTTFNSTKAEAKTISVTGVTQTAGVTVLHDVVSAATSTVAATGPITASTGTSPSNVTITLLDQFSNPVSGLQDTIWVGGNTGSNVIITQTGLSDVNGQSFGSFSKTTSGSTNVFAFINSLGTFTSNFATVTVNAAAASTVTVTNGGFSARVGTGVATRPTYTVKDAFGNVVPGQSVSITSGGGGTPSPISGTTNASGQFTLTSWTMGGTNADASNGTMSNTAQLTAGAATGTATDFGIYTFSGDVSPLFTGCAGCHNPNWTPSNMVGIASGCSGFPTLVVAGSASTSDVYNKLSATTPSCGSEMPLGGPFFSAGSLKIVRAWINNGGQNN